MNAIEIVKKLLLVHEGLRLVEYKCTAGHRTIGVGYNLDAHPLPSFIKPKKMNNGLITITNGEALELLDKSIQEHYDDLIDRLPFVENLDDVRKAVMIDLCFNMGISRLMSFVNTLGFLAQKRYADASSGLAHSKWATQVQKQRVNTIIELMRTGVLTDKIKADYGIE